MDLASIITALSSLVVAITIMVGTLRNGRNIRENHEVTVAIDHAVNGKAPGEQSMSGQVEDLHDQLPKELKVTNGDAILPLLRKIAADLEAKGSVTGV